ncbi:hypothetical protein [Streptomyces sp. NL15-2K]|uniref:hypothetical protein n=1 Tax=Streptomyces sp. NL15-2K TaxID=376149 RepID=UPI000F55F487|nr:MULTISPECIES: hypothetical protein [Actinomycetes]WKX08816.1 hypothetical protein Q4V64_15475 [Kutzneria buriramensis]GCB53252.1 hypothetical protein SNL152K_10609 [Streptomyces sp. NL15-2K]
MTTPQRDQRSRTDAPFLVGDRVRGTTYVPPDLRLHESPEPFEGVVVQLGSGYPKVDAKHAFLWIRLADHTERQSLVSETELVTRRRES